MVKTKKTTVVIKTTNNPKKKQVSTFENRIEFQDKKNSRSLYDYMMQQSYFENEYNYNNC